MQEIDVAYCFLFSRELKTEEANVAKLSFRADLTKTSRWKELNLENFLTADSHQQTDSIRIGATDFKALSG